MSFRSVAHSQAGLWLTHRQGFNRFYDQYAPSVYGYLLRQTNDAQVAKIRLSDTFQTAWNRREDFNQQQSKLKTYSPLTWLLSIVHETRF